MCADEDVKADYCAQNRPARHADFVVNQSGTNAQFKGTGTIEGLGDGYKFMLWAGDNDPDVDTFRILIWEGTEEDPEVLMYDNGPDDPITGGSIIIHKEKGKK